MATIALYIKSLYSGDVLVGPISITIYFFIKIPKSYSKKKTKSLIGKKCLNRCDLDNYIKKILDEIVSSGIILDDSQFVEIYAKKIWDDNPRTEFILDSKIILS